MTNFKHVAAVYGTIRKGVPMSIILGFTRKLSGQTGRSFFGVVLARLRLRPTRSIGSDRWVDEKGPRSWDNGMRYTAPVHEPV